MANIFRYNGAFAAPVKTMLRLFTGTIRSRALIILAVFVSTNADSAPELDEAHWIDLFNGKNLSAWTPKITGQAAGQDPLGTFSVKGGVLQVGYDNYRSFAGQFGHLFYRTPYSHYALNVEYRFVGNQLNGGPRGWALRNSGIMIHAQAPGDMQLKQDFPIALEVQLLGGLIDGQDRPTANVCTPGTDIVYAGKVHPHHCLNSASKTYPGAAWVNVTVVVLGGGSITHYIDGEEVLKYGQPTLSAAPGAHSKGNSAGRSLSRGYIAIQSKSHPVEFRKIRVLNLAGCTDPSAENFQPFYVKADGSCEYAEPRS